jgi:hypothetical protein
MVRKQSAWGLWWLVGLTLGIYYLVWYARINRELCAVLGREVPADGKGWATIIPILNLIGLVNTAGRLNEAHARVDSPVRVSTMTTLIWAPIWFCSHTRYLQRRMNSLADAVASASALGTASAGSAPILLTPAVAPEVETA